jgi:hypothetical protein
LWHEALNSLLVGGDYRIYQANISGNPLDFAEKSSFTDAEWVSQMRRER